MKFEISGEILGDIWAVETIASGGDIHILEFLEGLYGKGDWRKMKGFATVQFEDGTIADTELHWYEAPGIGRRDMKIKGFLPLM